MYNACTKRNIKGRLTRCANQALATGRALQTIFDDLPLAGINTDEADKELQGIITSLQDIITRVTLYRELMITED